MPRLWTDALSGHGQGESRGFSACIDGNPLRSIVALTIVGGLVMWMATAASPAGSPVVVHCVDVNAVVSGVVTRNGEPVGGLEVIAEVWPNDEVLASLVEGDMVPTMVAATAVTAGDGWFALSVEPASLGADYLGSEGSVDIALVAIDGEQYIDWSFSAERVRSPGSGGVWANPRVDPDVAVAGAAADRASTHPLIDIGPDASVLEDSGRPAECP